MRASLLHDIGKLGISNRILEKAGALTEETFATIRRHRSSTTTSSLASALRPIAETAANHHEKLDGSGYHRGVGAEHLDLPSRGLAVADIYDALSAARPYHVALPQERVLAMLRDDGGSKLDAECVALAGDLATRDEI
jgi:HD-GYP domain-containing protein (c-di-GMP phosphodiesterase class II)